MKNYLAQFTGRQVGAIGAVRSFAVAVSAPTEAAAGLRLYDTHEHITRLTLTEQPALPAIQPEDFAAFLGLLELLRDANHDRDFGSGEDALAACTGGVAREYLDKLAHYPSPGAEPVASRLTAEQRAALMELDKAVTAKDSDGATAALVIALGGRLGWPEQLRLLLIRVRDAVRYRQWAMAETMLANLED